MTITEAASRSCAHCGLPVPAPRGRGFGDGERVFCCFGCRLAASVVGGGPDDHEATSTLTRLGLGVFFAMNVMVFTIALWTQDIYPQETFGEGGLLLQSLFRYLCLLFTLPVVLLLGVPLAGDALTMLRRGRWTSDLLLSIGVTAAFLYSLGSVFRQQGHVYFEVVSMVLVAVTLGRWLESRGKVETTRALRSLGRLLPERTRRLSAHGDQAVPVHELRKGDLIRVLAGERLAADGRVVSGQADLDQQLVTGESLPVSVSAGDSVLAGSMNLDGAMTIRVVRAPGNTAIDHLVQTVTSAAQQKERWGRLADRWAARFLPMVVAASIAAFLWHVATGSLEEAVLSSLAVAVVACPCALALATPLALWAALGRAAREGIIVRSADALSRLPEVRTYCFDKTGTLTTGQPRVAQFVPDLDSDPCNPCRRQCQLSEIVLALCKCSSHPLAQAIARDLIGQQETNRSSHQRPTDKAPVTLSDVRTLSGRGLSAYCHELCDRVYLGSPRLMEEEGLSLSPQLRDRLWRADDEGLSVVAVGWKGSTHGLFLLDQELRAEVKEVLQLLKSRGHQVRILTGDLSGRADQLARQLGVQLSASLLPEDKLREIDRSKSLGPVAMVGDGLNDAPAMARADVGIALGCGADVTRQMADVCLLRSDVRQLVGLAELAADTTRTVKWNLWWASGYNLIAVPIAAAGWLNPILAALLMAGSSLFVVFHSLRLARTEPAVAVGPLPERSAVLGQRPVGRCEGASEVEPSSENGAIHVAGTGEVDMALGVMPVNEPDTARTPMTESPR